MRIGEDGRKLGHEFVRLVGQEKLGHVHRALLEHLQGRADAAGDGELDEGLELRRPRHADMDRQVDALGLQPVHPVDDRLRLEAELGGQRHLRVGAFGERLLPLQRLHHVAVRPVRVDVLVAFRVAGDVQPFEPVEEAGFDELHRVLVFTRRGRDAAGEEQRLLHLGLAPVAGDPVGEHRLVPDDARREMRHDLVALAGQALRGRHHVLDRGAVDMGDVDAGARGQEIAEVLDLLGGARHHLDRIALQEGLDLGAAAKRCGRAVLAAEVQDRHCSPPKLAGCHAQPSFAMSALRRSVS